MGGQDSCQQLNIIGSAQHFATCVSVGVCHHFKSVCLPCQSQYKNMNGGTCVSIVVFVSSVLGCHLMERKMERGAVKEVN